MSSRIKNVSYGKASINAVLATSGVYSCIAVVILLDDNRTYMFHIDPSMFNLKNKNNMQHEVQNLIKRSILMFNQRQNKNNSSFESIPRSTNTESLYARKRPCTVRIPPYTTRRYTVVIRSHVNRRISVYTVVYDRACSTWVVALFDDSWSQRSSKNEIQWHFFNNVMRSCLPWNIYTNSAIIHILLRDGIICIESMGYH